MLYVRRYTPVEISAFIIGMTSIGFWLVCQLPQFVKNWQRMSVDALSPWFLLEWLLGDIFNFSGSVLVRVVPTQLYLAGWFCVMDVFILSQYVYLSWLNWGKEDSAALEAKALLSEEFEPLHSSDTGADGGMRVGAGAGVSDSGLISRTEPNPWSESIGENENPAGAGAGPDGRAHVRRVAAGAGRGMAGVGVVVGAVAVGLSVIAALAILPATGLFDAPVAEADASSTSPASRLLRLDTCISHESIPKGASVAGAVLGWISSLLYLNSRLPQVYKNWKRGTVEGLSWLMFFCSFMGNVTSSLGIIMRATTRSDWVREAPFLPGMLGTIFLDVTIITQYFVYTARANERRKRRAELREQARTGADVGVSPSALLDTPVLIPSNAKHGIHDIIEDVPTPRDVPRNV